MSTKKSNLKFEFKGKSRSGLTNIYEVKAGRNDFVLGEIKWYSNWRRYIFVPRQNTLYDSTCLEELAIQCESMTKYHKHKDYIPHE